jgi:hypothetical protein
MSSPTSKARSRRNLTVAELNLVHNNVAEENTRPGRQAPRVRAYTDDGEQVCLAGLGEGGEKLTFPAGVLNDKEAEIVDSNIPRLFVAIIGMFVAILGLFVYWLRRTSRERERRRYRVIARWQRAYRQIRHLVHRARAGVFRWEQQPPGLLVRVVPRPRERAAALAASSRGTGPWGR